MTAVQTRVMLAYGPLAASDKRLVRNNIVAPPAPMKKKRPRQQLLPPTDPLQIEEFERAAMRRAHDRVIAMMAPTDEPLHPWFLEDMR